MTIPVQARHEERDARGRGIAIVTESVECGGTERVVQALAERFPEATIVVNHFSDLMEPDPLATPWAMKARIVPSGARKRHFLGPLYARRLAATPLAGARLVVALQASGWALGAALAPGSRMLCYSTGPPPALYGQTDLYLRSERLALRPVMRAALPGLRAYYRRMMRRPDRLIANSSATAAAIARVYRRRAEVIHPPVRTDFFTPAPAARRHFLAVARLVPQKRLDLLLDAFRGLDERLLVVGRGPWVERLRARAPSNVRFEGWVDDARLRALYRSSCALVCPSVEEFGIVMAEAHACGTPVIAPRAGGACEIVDDATTGILVERLDSGMLRGAVSAAARREFDGVACRASAERFSEQRFTERMERVIEEELAAVAAARP